MPSKQLIRQVSTLLAVRAGSAQTITVLYKLLGKLGYTRQSIQDAYLMSIQQELRVPEVPLMQRKFWSAYQYRAAYILSAARRLTLAQHAKNYNQAKKLEEQYFKSHVAAHDKRVDAMTQTFKEAAKQVKAQGIDEDKMSSDSAPVMLGWYSKMDAITSLECRLANGKNFDALKGTIIGYPGSVHPHCRCKAGPPHATEALVDDAVRTEVKGRERALT